MVSQEYIGLVALLIDGLLTPLALWAINWLFAPRTRKKDELVYQQEPYECGEEPIGSARINLDIQFISYAILFTGFDVMVNMLLLWGIIATQLPMELFLVAMVFFSFGLLVVFYWWMKGELRWYQPQ